MAENYVYGVNLPVSQLKTVLADMQRNQQGVSTWNQILGATSLGYQKQQSALTQQYGDAITEAYKAHLGANREIANLGLNEAQRAEQLGLSAFDLENTYNKYLSSFAQDAQTLADQYSKNISAIDETLTQEAENYSKLLNSAYTYLSEELVPATLSDDKGNIISNYLDKSALNRYIKDGVLMSQQELYGDYLFTPEGQLTNEGREFFDAIYNIQDLAGYSTYREKDKETFDTRSFDKWLSDTDIELRNFFASVDPYNFNFAGTRKGTLQQMLGMESTDNVFNESEYSYRDKSKLLLAVEKAKIDVDNKKKIYEELDAKYFGGLDAKKKLIKAKEEYEKAIKKYNEATNNYNNQLGDKIYKNTNASGL